MEEKKQRVKKYNKSYQGMSEVPRIKVDDKIFKRCPICGGACNDYEYKQLKLCKKCNNLKKQGINIEELKAIRKVELTNELKDKDVEVFDGVSDLTGKKIEDLTDSSFELDVKVNTDKILEYDFKKYAPPGITVKGDNTDEARLIKEAYSAYANGIEHISEFNALINSILFNTLESYRLNKLRTEKKDDMDTVKTIIDLHTKLSTNTNNTSKMLTEMKEVAMNDSGNTIMKEFSKMLAFHHENEQSYMGVGVCDECGQRVVFKSYFRTFKNIYEERMQDVSKRVLEMGGDANTVRMMKGLILKYMTDDTFKESYTVYHKRKLEHSLL